MDTGLLDAGFLFGTMKEPMRAILLLLALAPATGCFVVSVENSGHKDSIGGFILPQPSSAHEVVSGSRILPEEVAFVQPGRTSRAEITNLFNQPWASYPDLGVMVYYWECVDWHWVGGVFCNNDSVTGSGDVTSLHYWFVKFDDTDLVQKHGFIRASPNTPTKKLAERWLNGRL